MGDIFYSKLKTNVVIKQIKKYGKNISLSQYVPGTIDPITDQEVPGTPVIYNGYGLQTEFKENEIDGKRILKTDVKLIAVEIPDPDKINDKIIINGIKYNIVDYTDLKPGNISMLFKLQLRK